jgi:hypothetical protein
MPSSLSLAFTSQKHPAIRRRTKSFSPTSTTVTPSRSTRCNTRSSGSLVLTTHVVSRSPTPATLRSATWATAALVAATHVARRLVLRARVRPLVRTPLAVPAALVALSLPRLILSIPTGATKVSTRNRTRELFICTQFSNLYNTVDTPARVRVGVTTLSPPSFKATT